ncbi:hypothetical protein ACFQ07_11165, partial [Actinomadura adrarensis]
WAQATLAVLGEQGPEPLACIMPWEWKDVCTAALTYWLVQKAEGRNVPQAGLDALATQISAFVDASRRG